MKKRTVFFSMLVLSFGMVALTQAQGVGDQVGSTVSVEPQAVTGGTFTVGQRVYCAFIHNDNLYECGGFH